MALSKPIGSYFNQLVYAIGNYHYNWHPEIELLMVLKGTAATNIDGYQYALQANDLVLINSNQGHATLATAPGTLAIRTHIAPEFYEEQGVKLGAGRFELNSATIPYHPQYADLRRAIVNQYLAENEFAFNSACFALTSLLYQAFFVTGNQDRLPTHRKAHFSQVASDIQEHFRQPLTLEKLANKYGYSQPYFSKIFKQHFGIGFYEYLTRERLQHALSDLNNSSGKIGSVALNNGFTEIKSFNHAFKKHFGLTPSAYQAKFSPQFKEVDAHFKQRLNPTQQAEANRLLHQLADSATMDNSQSCEECIYRQDSQRYQQLKKELRKLLNDKK